MSATIYQMPPRATGEVNQKERAMSEVKDRYDSMSRAELRAECDARGIKWAPIERVALAEAPRFADFGGGPGWIDWDKVDPAIRRSPGRIGGAALREALRTDDAKKREEKDIEEYSDITDAIDWTIEQLHALLDLPLEAHDHLARPALTRKACELALDLLSDHT